MATKKSGDSPFSKKMQTGNLFAEALDEDKTERPLADRLRPQALEDFFGQEHLLGAEGFLRKILSKDLLPSMIFWGPPGSGKTTLAHLIAKKTQRKIYPFSAVLFGLSDLRKVVELAKEDQIYQGRASILFVDEIHRFNKAQQDAFLPHVESGAVILIGATTENPSFEVIRPLLSRSRLLVLKPLSEADLHKVLDRAKTHPKGLGRSFDWDPDATELLIKTSEGDARRLIGTLEIAASLPQVSESKMTVEVILKALEKRFLHYDTAGEEHYNVISAFIKSMRGSDPDAAVYWLARLLEAGEDPLFVARRMIIFASEDIGNADPQALTLAVAAFQAFDRVGMPEGWIPLAHVATYLASAPKSRASYESYKKALREVEKTGSKQVPLHLRNAITSLMKSLGYGKGYQGASTELSYLPEGLSQTRFYEPTNSGYEKTIAEFLRTKQPKESRT